jgi:hypothetical protein
MQSFGISKLLAGGRPTWLTRSFPLLTWGPQADAARYLTPEAAWMVIGRLSYPDGSGAAVSVLDEPRGNAD